MFCKQLIVPGTETCCSYPQQTLTALHNTDNIQLCVSDLKARQAARMTDVALEETRICAKAQCPQQPRQSVIHTVYTYYSHKHKGCPLPPQFMYGFSDCMASVHISVLLHPLLCDIISITDCRVESLSAEEKSHCDTGQRSGGK